MRESNLIYIHTHIYTAKNIETPQMLNCDSVIHSYAPLYFLNVYNHLH